jgi:RNA polymerase sigma factor (sigma-70 family)
MEAVVERCRLLVYSVTNTYFSRGAVTRQDLEQAGFLGLLTAVQTYDGRRAFLLHAYKCVRAETREAVRHAGVISLPRLERYWSGRSACDRAGEAATPENMAARTDHMSVEWAVDVERARFVRSLDAPRYGDDSDDHYSYLRVGGLRPTENAALGAIWRETFWAHLAAAMQKNLSAYERQVTELRLAGTPHSEIAARLGVTKPASETAYHRAKRKLREALRDWQVPRRGAYRGVQRNKRRWNASIFVQGRYFFLGTFVSVIDAARAYDAAALKYHGDKAKLNFPERAPAREVA